jgi:hypothetical protein
VNVNFRYLRRSGDHYLAVYNVIRENFVDSIGITRDWDGPEEGNFILRIGGQKRLSRFANLYAEAGFDRKRNADFSNGKSAKDFLANLTIAFHY